MAKTIKLSIALLAAGAAGFALPSAAQEKLTVWFSSGFYKAEDDAIDEAVRKFEQKTGTKVELSRYAVQEIIPKTVAAIDAGNPPDVAFGRVYDFQVTAKWAYEGKLEDISSVIAPIKDRFLKGAAEATYLYNDKARKKAYYAFPLQQQTMHIQYWKDMLAEAGYGESDIPTGWKAYWDFWCDKVQPALRTRTGKHTYAIGNPMGTDSSDSFFSFLTFMDAYNVTLVDDDGKLLVEEPKVRQGLISAMRDYTSIRSRDCTPAASTRWKDPDNNASFHNKSVVMTHNTSIAIAVKWLEDANNTTLPAERRAEARKNYDERLATSGFPRKPDGSPMTYRAAVKTGVIFVDAKNKARAREFVAVLLADENLTPFVEGALGRWYPVTKAGAASPFWQSDPHRRSVHRQFSAGTTPFEFTRNHRFTALNNENVWAKAMNRVTNDGWTVEKAVDEMIARIKQVAGS